MAIGAVLGGIVLVVLGLAQAAGGILGGPGSPSTGLAVVSGSPAASRDTRSSAVPTAPLPSGTPSPTTSPAPSASGSPNPGTVTAARDRRLQATLDRLRTKLALPGVTATILFPDGSSWSGASGFADVRAKVPATPDTAFAFASMSKTFTSAEILQLVDEGRLRLGDSAASRLPKLPIAIDRRITVGMLLDHTSGLADYFLNPKIDAVLQRRPTATWTPIQALRYVGKRLSPPGKAWHYSNTNYLLLGLIAERIEGRPLADSIRARFLDPFGLGATWYQAAEPARAVLAHAYRLPGTSLTVKPVDLADGSGVAPFRSVVTAAGGAGSIAGTSADLARWARTLYGGRVLGPIGTALLLSDFRKTTNYVVGASYGYGVQALSIDGHASLGHSGRLLGMRGVVRHFPIDGITIAVLTNQSRADPARVLRSLLAVVVPRPSTSPVPTPSPSSSPCGPCPSVP